MPCRDVEIATPACVQRLSYKQQERKNFPRKSCLPSQPTPSLVACPACQPLRCPRMFRAARVWLTDLASADSCTSSISGGRPRLARWMLTETKGVHRSSDATDCADTRHRRVRHCACSPSRCSRATQNIIARLRILMAIPFWG